MNEWGIQYRDRNSLGLVRVGRERSYQGRESYGEAALGEAGAWGVLLFGGDRPAGRKPVE